MMTEELREISRKIIFIYLQDTIIHTHTHMLHRERERDIRSTDFYIFFVCIRERFRQFLKY